MNNLNTVKTGHVAGILSVAFFALCMLWGFVLSDPTLKELHLNILRIAYPGFGMSLVGFLIGAVEAFIYGWVFGALLAWLCRKMCIGHTSNE